MPGAFIGADENRPVMKGVLKDAPAARQAFEVGDPPIRRGMIVLGEAGFGEHGHRYYLCEIDDSGASTRMAGRFRGRLKPAAGRQTTAMTLRECN
jgi:hypothetical protein